MLNIKVLAILVLLIVGIYMMIAYRQGVANSFINSEEIKKEFRIKRYIGAFLILIAVALIVYMYYTGELSKTFKAFMYPARECAGCEVYVKRHRGLRPYHDDEYSALQAHAASCDRCSQLCIKDLQGQKARGAPAELQAFTKQECVDATEHAILAKRELSRLTDRLRSKQAGVAAFKAKQYGDVSAFPAVPVK